MNIAVVIPVYNVAPCLRRCLDSVIVAAKECLSSADHQPSTISHQPSTFDLQPSSVEIVCVDDGSTDGSGEILDAYEAKAQPVVASTTEKGVCRFRVLHQPNAGLSAARNAALDLLEREKTATHVMFVDSDDWVAPNCLAALVRGLADGAEISAARCVRTASDAAAWNASAPASWRTATPREFWALPGTDASAVWGKLYPMSLFEGVRYPVGKINEDESTTYRLFFRAARVAYSDAALYAYFVRPGSVMNTQWSARRLDRLQAWRDQIRFFGERGFAELAANSRKGLVLDLVDAVRNLRRIGEWARAEDCRRELAAELKAGGMGIRENYLAHKTAWPARTRLACAALKCLGIVCK